MSNIWQRPTPNRRLSFARSLLFLPVPAWSLWPAEMIGECYIFLSIFQAITSPANARRGNRRFITQSTEYQLEQSGVAMDELDAIKRRADSWYDLMLSEVDKAVQKAFEHAGKSPGQDENICLNKRDMA